MNIKKNIHLIVALIVVVTLGCAVATVKTTQAAPATFTVNSTGDGNDANNGDGICETSTPGECTLRAAIEQANTNGNPGDTDVIEFNIAGTGLKTIAVSSSPLYIIEPVEINGYTQTGALANTQAWPAALDTNLTIEINSTGLLAGSAGILNLGGAADGSILKGLVINAAADYAVYTEVGNDGSHIEGNFLNTDDTGLLQVVGAASRHAISTDGTNATIGGSAPEQRNVITARGSAISSTGSGNIIKGNNIMVGSDSITPLTQDPNFGSSVAVVGVGGANNQIGGSAAGEGNTITNGLLYCALLINGGTNTVIQGNRITDSLKGVVLSGSTDTTIGGSTAEERNVISGNLGASGISGSGIETNSGTTRTTVKGNYIGVDSTGSADFGNADFGINSQDGGELTIGGSAAGEGNVISGNDQYGLRLTGNTTAIVQGNYIGVGADGTSSIPNGSGITAPSTNASITIGGSAAGEGNVISGNDQYGIEFESAITEVIGNKIGVASDGTTAVGNGDAGILAHVNVDTYALLGGTSAGSENIIANNGGAGIAVSGVIDQAINKATSILGNSIYDNTGLGIDLSNDGVTANDALDQDFGPNDLLNAPALLPPVVNGSDTDITYRIDVPDGLYRIEFFSNSAYDPTGYGEGETFIGADTITSSGAGPQIFTSTVTGNTHDNISATLTRVDPETTSGYGATSEFSGPPYIEISTGVAKSIVDQTTIATDSTIQYNVSFSNTGIDTIDLTQYLVDSGDPLNTAMFSEIFPANLTLDSVTGDVALDCSEQNPSSNFGALLADHASYTVASCSFNDVSTSLAPDATLNFTLTFSVTDPTQTVFSNYLLAVPDSSDENYSTYDDAINSGNDILTELDGGIDNVANATTTQPEGDISITKTLLTDPGDVAPGGTLSYQLTYTNESDVPFYLNDKSSFFASQPLFYDYMHPDLQISAGSILTADYPSGGFNIIDVGNSDLNCVETPPGYAGVVFGLTKYGDYGFIACWWNGSDQSLASGASLTATLNFDVASDSTLDFANYALANAETGGSHDPDSSAMGDVAASGEDTLDGLINYQDPINNFAVSRLPIDVTLSSQVIDPPETISEGTPLKYEVTIQNNGPASFNFSQYPSLNDSVLTGIFSDSDLTYVSAENNSVSCLPLGAGSVGALGAAGQNHSGYSLLICFGLGSDVVIPPGESRSVVLNFVAKSSVTSSFNFYAINASAQSDLDIPILIGEIFSATGDILDTIENNNFTRASYSGIVVTPQPPVSENPNTTSTGDLSGTGEDRKRVLYIAIAVLAAGSVALVAALLVKKRQKTSEK